MFDIVFNVVFLSVSVIDMAIKYHVSSNECHNQY